MPHLTGFGIKNFRVFKEKTWFDPAPITVLTGPNNSGKSSAMLKSLQLLKDSIKIDPQTNKIDFFSLDFTKTSHNLGGFSKVKCRNSKDDTISLYFKVLLSGQSLELCLSYKKDDKSSLDNAVLHLIEFRDIKTDKPVISFQYKEDYWDANIDYLYFYNRLTEITKEKEKKNQKIERYELLDKIENPTESQQVEKEELRYLYENEVAYTVNINKEDTDHMEFIDIKVWLVHEIEEENQKNVVFTPEKSLFQLIGTDDFLSEIEHIDENGYNRKTEIEKPDFSEKIIKEKIKELYRNRIQRQIKYHNNVINEFKKNNQTKMIKDKEKEIERLESINIEERANTLFLIAKSSDKTNQEDTLKEEIELLENIDYKSLNQDGYYYVGKNPDISSKFYNLLESLKRQSVLEITKHYNKEFQSDLLDRFKWNEDLFLLTHIIKHSNYEVLMHSITKFISKSFSEIKRMLEKIEFIEINRNKTQRIYRFSDNSQYLNNLLISYGNINEEQINKHSKFVEQWLNEFNIAKTFKIQYEKEGTGAYIYLDDILMSDLGFGVSQVFPILLQILLIACKSRDENYPEYNYYYHAGILFIEEPESNLHPALQSKLAEMFIDASRRFNIQFILETHSEYLIRKLQYLTAQKKISTKDSAIYYFHHPEKVPKGEKQVKKIDIQEDGSLSDDFGPGFFDEADNLALELFKYSKSNK